jgi:type II secretory pathway pseudopilin PulG
MRLPRRATAGFSLIELLIAVTMLVAVMGATYAIFRSQSVAFRENTRRFDLVQNARSSIELSERVIRTMGAGVTGQQPMLVYGANSVLAFNADYIERDTVDMRWAAYWNPDVPLTEQTVWPAATATVIPNSSPNYTYPTVTYTMSNGAQSPAETHILYFLLDDATARSDDYALWQRVNAGTPEILARNLLPAADGSPFFEYLLHRVLPTGDTMFVATGGLLPLIRRELIAGISTADSADYVRPDSVRAVRMNYQVTNGQVGADERIRSISTVIETPNNGIAMPTVCGRPPLPPGAFSLSEVGTGLGQVHLVWSRSADQDAGEVDVRQYVIWRKLSSDAIWGPPLLVIRTEPGQAAYDTNFFDNLPNTSYDYRIAAQDCTPNFSTTLTQSITLSPIP